MINNQLYKSLEKQLISKLNRFPIVNRDLLELKKAFKNKVLLITGAAGSIGSQFSQDILKYNLEPSKIIYLDKDENSLTELNRELLLYKNFRNINTEFICSDLTSIDLDKILKTNYVQFYLNFAAIKHVRSEENLESIKYMLNTNSIKFLPSNLNYLEKIFSVSTDKTVNPSSILGVTKYLMEINLNQFAKKSFFISSARFANVAFSNGSILKYIVDRLCQKKNFGVPAKIKRFFITHSEASSLCFKSLLKRNNHKIIIPNPKMLKRDILIIDLAKKIVKKFKFYPKFYSNFKIKNNYSNKICYILLTKLSDGQKYSEEFFYKNEKIIEDIDPSICKVEFPNLRQKVNRILKKIINLNNIDYLKKYLIKNLKYYNPPKKIIKISKHL